MAGVSVKIGADDREFQAAIKRTKKELSGMAKEARDGIDSFAKWGAAATAAGLAASAYLVKGAIDGARELEKMRQVANAGTAEFQKGAFAVRSLAIETDKYADILKDVNDRVGDFIQTGGGPMADFFEKVAPKVGVTAQQFQKLSGPQALQLYVDSLQKANLSQQDMTFYMEAMASDATALLPLLRDGGAAMAAQADQAERLGLVMSDIDVAQLEQASASMSQVASVFEGFVNQLSSELAPVITAISKQFLQVTEDAGGVGEAASDSFKFIVDSAAFVMDAIHGIQVVFKTVADAIIIGASSMAIALTKPFEDMTYLLSLLPGEAGDTFKQVHAEVAGFSGNLRGVVVEAMDAIDRRLMEPLPSGQFKEFVAEARIAGEESAKALVEGRKAVEDAQRGGGGDVVSEADRVAAEEHKKQIAERIERIRQANLTEIDLQKEKYAAEQEALREARELGLEIKGGYDNAEQEAKARHEQALLDIQKRISEDEDKLFKKRTMSKEEAMSTMFSNLSSLMNSESRKMFDIGKAAATSQAIIDTISSAQASFNALAGIPIVGPSLGAAAAAAAIAGGMARVQQIRSQSFGSGGSAGAGGGGGFSAPAQTPGVGIQGQQQQTQQFNISLADEGMFSGRQVRQLIGQINDQTQNNGVVLVTGG